MTTSNSGCLGSPNDEERRQLRYVMWIADVENHQIFERKLYHFAMVWIFEWGLIILLRTLHTSARRLCVVLRDMIVSFCFFCGDSIEMKALACFGHLITQRTLWAHHAAFWFFSLWTPLPVQRLGPLCPRGNRHHVCCANTHHTCAQSYPPPQIIQDYSLNLSILLREGKETN